MKLSLIFTHSRTQLNHRDSLTNAKTFLHRVLYTVKMGSNGYCRGQQVIRPTCESIRPVRIVVGCVTYSSSRQCSVVVGSSSDSLTTKFRAKKDATLANRSFCLKLGARPKLSYWQFVDRLLGYDYFARWRQTLWLPNILRKLTRPYRSGGRDLSTFTLHSPANDARVQYTRQRSDAAVYL